MNQKVSGHGTTMAVRARLAQTKRPAVQFWSSIPAVVEVRRPVGSGSGLRLHG